MIRFLLCSIVLLFAFSSVFAQEEKRLNHQFQLGFYMHEVDQPAVGVLYSYRLNNYFSLIGGLTVGSMAYRGYDPSSYSSDKTLWAQFYGNYTRATFDEENIDGFLIGTPLRHQSVVSRFNVIPKLGVKFNTPRFLKQRLELDFGISVYLEATSENWITHQYVMHWFDMDGNYYGEFRYFMNYYRRSISVIGFSYDPALKYYFSDKSFVGLHLNINSYPERNVWQSFIGTFKVTYATYGVFVGTTF